MFKRNQNIDFFKVKKRIVAVATNRLVILGIVLVLLFFLLVDRLFVLQIVEGEEHLSNFNYKVEKTIEISGARGNIYDCNGKLLAYNELAYKVTIQTTDETAEIAKERSTENKTVEDSTVRNEVIYNLIKILEENGDEVIYDLPLEVNSKGVLKFTVSGTTLTRFKKDIYGIGNVDKLEGEEKQQAEQWINATPEEVYEYLRTGANGPSGVANMFNIDDSYSVEDTLKIMSVRYDLYMNRYSQTTPVTVASNISDESIAAITEHLDEFPGVSIETDSLRKYTDSVYFSNIIGYTGVVSESELESLNADGGTYKANDVVGKTGIEKTMESTLQGEKGEKNVLVDNLGKIIKTVSTTDAKAGDDVYLTIDADLQKYAYNILERRLAGIILAHMTTADEAGSNKMIPVKDIYYALIDNNIIDISHFDSSGAGKYEQAVYKLFEKRQSNVLSAIKKELKSGNTLRKDYSDAKADYINYAVQFLIDNNILDQSLIKEDDEVYQNWNNGKTTIKKFLKHAISNEWIDISSFNIESDYYDADEIYSELISYIVDSMKQEEDFDKLLYKYMIKDGTLSGKKVCMLLFDQGVLDKKKDSDYKDLANNSLSAYNFIYEKIKDLDITPAQLALDPCSGSIIITDPANGDVKAMVSYPSYDNNRLANGIDSDYYASLNEDNSSPMLNRCTQTRTAPGSTFKPITSTAVLEEGVANTSTYVKCTGLFDKITPNAKCWIYPNAHGSLNVSGAIAVSCNFFFYQMGYNLGSTNGVYDSSKGLSILAKYAKLYGLDRKSGVEITEYEPQISDEDAVRSAIGQGTHSYTPSQLSRYLTSLVNEKSLLNLTLLDKTTDVDGNLIEEFESTSADTLDVSDTTFAAIAKGMRDVVSGKDSSIKYLYKGLGLKVAGKTGTAQENKKRPNHALFISYAPYDAPEITMTVVVPNGYTSSNAAEIARDVYKYYFNTTTPEEENATGALLPTGSDGSHD